MLNFNRRLTLGLTVAALVVVPAYAEDMTAKVQEMNGAWDAALNSGDAAKIASMYSEDAKVVTGDGTVKQGRKEIEALFQGFVDSGFGKHKIEMADLKGTDELIYETGAWSGVGGDGKDYGGKLVLIFKHTADDDWETVLHMWN